MKKVTTTTLCTLFFLLLFVNQSFGITLETSCVNIRIRREIRDLTQQERNLYFKAVIKVKKAGILDDFTKRHSKSKINLGGQFELVHSTAFFLPWHRAFTKEYEQALSLHLPLNLGIPFWNWTIDAKDPKASIIFTKDYVGSIDPTVQINLLQLMITIDPYN